MTISVENSETSTENPRPSTVGNNAQFKLTFCEAYGPLNPQSSTARGDLLPMLRTVVSSSLQQGTVLQRCSLN